MLLALLLRLQEELSGWEGEGFYFATHLLSLSLRLRLGFILNLTCTEDAVAPDSTTFLLRMIETPGERMMELEWAETKRTCISGRGRAK